MSEAETQLESHQRDPIEEVQESGSQPIFGFTEEPRAPPPPPRRPIATAVRSLSSKRGSPNPAEGSAPPKHPKMDPNVIDLLTSLAEQLKVNTEQLKVLPTIQADMQALNATIKNQVEIAVRDKLVEHTTEQDRKLDERFKTWEERFAKMGGSTPASSKGSGQVPFVSAAPGSSTTFSARFFVLKGWVDYSSKESEQAT